MLFDLPGGTASGGDLNIQGGASSIQNLATNAAVGGDCPLGGFGGKENVGTPGKAPGGGGSNANFTGTSAAGAVGEILVTEYY